MSLSAQKLETHPQNKILITADHYDALILRGRELQDALDSCLSATKHFMQEIPSLEAIIATSDNLLHTISINYPDIGLSKNQPFPQRLQAFFAKQWQNAKAYLSAFLTGSITTIIVFTIILL